MFLFYSSHSSDKRGLGTMVQTVAEQISQMTVYHVLLGHSSQCLLHSQEVGLLRRNRKAVRESPKRSEHCPHWLAKRPFREVGQQQANCDK